MELRPIAFRLLVVLLVVVAGLCELRGEVAHRDESTSLVGTAKLSVQVDVGFGDAVEPGPENVVIPTLLDMAEPTLRAYRREVVIAEKFHAMVLLGRTNSRMKDYFDIAYLASRFTFDGASMAHALKATFARRDTLLPKEPPVGITSAFAAEDQKAKQWRSFQTNVRAPAQQSLLDFLAAVHAFVWPPCAATAEQRPFTLTWSNGRWI